MNVSKLKSKLVGIAAGLAGMSRRAVYVYGALSSLLWNLVLFAAGAYGGPGARPLGCSREMS